MFGAAKRVNQATAEFARLASLDLAKAQRTIAHLASLAGVSSAEVMILGNALMRAVDQHGDDDDTKVQRAIDQVTHQYATGALRMLSAPHVPLNAVLSNAESGVLARETIRLLRPQAWQVYYAAEAAWEAGFRDEALAGARLRLQEIVPWGPDSEAIVAAELDGAHMGGVAWIVGRFILWAPSTIDARFCLSGSTLTELESRPTEVGTQYLLTFEGPSDDPFPLGETEYPVSPWRLALVGETSAHFEDDLVSLSRFIDRRGRGRFVDGARELARRRAKPVASWADCPLCGVALNPTVFPFRSWDGVDGQRGVAWCGACVRAFSDPDVRPRVDRSPDSFGQILRVSPHDPLMIEVTEGTSNLPQVWQVAPLEFQWDSPPEVADDDVLLVAAGSISQSPKQRWSGVDLDALWGRKRAE